MAHSREGTFEEIISVVDSIQGTRAHIGLRTLLGRSQDFRITGGLRDVSSRDSSRTMRDAELSLCLAPVP